MKPQATLNQWGVASTLMRELAESGYFDDQVNADRRKTIFIKLAQWSEANNQVYGTYELYDEQVQTTLEAATKDSLLSDAMSILVESEMLGLSVSHKGEVQLELPVWKSN